MGLFPTATPHRGSRRGTLHEIGLLGAKIDNP